MKRLLLLAALATAVSAAELPVKLTKFDDRVRVEIGGSLFTEYVFKGASRPYCYPVLAPDGTSLTRDYPMKTTPGEETDHVHHRALQFAHGDANQIDFWDEGTSGNKFPKGLTQTDAPIETTDGDVGVLHAHHRWVTPDGRIVGSDDTTLRFSGTADARILDYEITIRSLLDQPLVLGDSKEGTMAIRVAQWLTIPHKYQGKDVASGGHIVTANGDRDAAAWGKRADWCDYYAPHDGKTYGIAIFDHPSNLRHPTWWMARDYGLFAANPFGQSSFESTKEKPLPPDLGQYTIPAGAGLTLRYRFYFHNGDADSAKIAAHYADYAAGR